MAEAEAGADFRRAAVVRQRSQVQLRRRDFRARLCVQLRKASLRPICWKAWPPNRWKAALNRKKRFW